MNRLSTGILLIVLIAFCSFYQTFGQGQAEQLLRKLEDPQYPEYRLKSKNEIARYSKFDFSHAIKPQSEFLGFIEPDFQRLKVYFNFI